MAVNYAKKKIYWVCRLENGYQKVLLIQNFWFFSQLWKVNNKKNSGEQQQLFHHKKYNDHE